MARSEGEEQRIRSLLARARDERTRDAAEGLLNGRTETIPIIGPLLDVIKDPKSRWEDKTSAAWSLGRARLSPDQREAAAATLGWYLQDHPLTSLTIDPPGRTTLQAALGIAVLSVYGLLSRPEYLHLTWIPLVGMIWTIGFVAYRAQRREIELKSTAARSLARIGSPNSLKPASALYRQSQSVRLPRGARHLKESAREALVSTLEAIEQYETGAAASDSVYILGNLLKSRDEEIARLSLLAMRAVGDGRGIPAVEKLIRSNAHPNLAALAEETLAVLNRRKQIAADSANLLRPAGSGSPDGLLRPASGGSGAEENLLRAMDSGGLGE